MRQFFKKALAVVLTGVLLAGASISAAAAPQELSVTPTVASGEAAVEGDVITLTEGKAATVAFQPSQELDIIEYQYSLAQPSDTNESIVDVTVWETADSLVPAYSFSGLKEGTYQITLTLTENTGYTTVFQKEYTVKVQAAPVPVTVAPAVVSGKANISGDVITLTEGTAATIAFQPSPALDIFGYQHSFRQPESTLSLIEDVTDWETADTLVPTYFFSGELKEGTYQIALTLTENTGYTTVFEKEYTVQVVASEPEEPENPDVVIDQDKDVPQVSLGMDQAELAESLLTEEEINAGAQIVISVEKAELSEQQKELFQNAMSGYQEGVYLDISLFKVLNDQSAAITETKKPIRLTISIPEELRKDGRTFVIYREHNGVVELLKDLDNDPATVTIESDQFSVFALAYSDGQAGVSSGEAGSSSASGSSGGSSNDKYVPTGDGFPAAVVSAVLLISAALVLVLVKGKRGKASE